MGTKIEWTDETWNPVSGCTKVSSGCRNCYAERFAGRGMGEWKGRKFTDVQCHEDRLSVPHKRKKPTRYFVNSMSDLFHKDVPDLFIDRIVAVVARTRRHTYQALTKRPERMKAYCSTWAALSPKQRTLRLAEAVYKGHVAERLVLGSLRMENVGELDWPLPNLWLGVSVEDQKTFNERTALLKRTPAAHRFVSAEPLLSALGTIDLTGIDWLICGGESGPGARLCKVEWIRSIVRQCKASQVPCFVKQLGSHIDEAIVRCLKCGHIDSLEQFDVGGADDGKVFCNQCNEEIEPESAITDPKGGAPAEWPEDLRDCREVPTSPVMA